MNVFFCLKGGVCVHTHTHITETKCEWFKNTTLILKQMYIALILRMLWYFIFPGEFDNCSAPA